MKADKLLTDLKHYRNMELHYEDVAKNAKKQAKECRARIDEILDAEMESGKHVELKGDKWQAWKIGDHFQLTDEDYETLDLDLNDSITALVDTMNDIADKNFEVKEYLRRKLVYQMEMFKDSEMYKLQAE